MDKESSAVREFLEPYLDLVSKHEVDKEEDNDDDGDMDEDEDEDE